MTLTFPAGLDHMAWGVPRLQLAADGSWEHAQELKLPCAGDAWRDALEALGSEDRAVEVLWPGPPTVFIGFRGPDCARLLDTVARRRDWTPCEVLELAAGGPLGDPVHAEVGAINRWRSVGPMPVPFGASCREVTLMLQQRPDLETCPVPVALEVVHRCPNEVWWAMEVSVQRPRRHLVVPSRISALLADLAPLPSAERR